MKRSTQAGRPDDQAYANLDNANTASANTPFDGLPVAGVR
jgi:hypothetical protein